MSASSCTVSSKTVFCELCGVYIPSVSQVKAHNKGKKHQRFLKHKEDRLHSAQKSIYVTGFRNSGSLEQDFTTFFDTFGKVKKVFVDKNKGAYAIIEFDIEEAVNVVLKEQELPLFNGRHLKVKGRTLSNPKSIIRESKSPVNVNDNKNQKESKKRQPRFPSFLEDDLICKLQEAAKVEEQVQLLIEELSLKYDDIKLRNLVCQLLQEIFGEAFINSDIKAFGSSTNGLGWKKCDLDLCLLTGEPNKPQSISCPQDKHTETSVKNEDVFSEAVTVLRSFAPGCTNIVPVMTAKCPVIRFIHKPSGLQCDLSIDNRLGLCNTGLLKDFISLDPRVTHLVWIVRVWAKAKGLSGGGVGQLTSYALTLMVLYYLQCVQPPVIPSLQNIGSWPMRATNEHHTSCGCQTSCVDFACEHRKDVELDSCCTCDENKQNYLQREIETNIIDGWDCSYFRNVSNLAPSQNQELLENLLEGFFDFFGNKFDFGNCVVSIRKGERTTKEEVNRELSYHNKSVVNRVEKEMSPGCHKDRGDKKDKDQNCSGVTEINNVSSFKITPLCIQDPFELTHNVAQNVSVAALKRIIQLMMDACRTVKSFLYAKEGQPKFKGILNLFTTPPQTSKKKLDNTFSFFVKFRQSRCTSPSEELATEQNINIAEPISCTSVTHTRPTSIASIRSAFDAAVCVLKDKLGMSCDLTTQQAVFTEEETVYDPHSFSVARVGGDEKMSVNSDPGSHSFSSPSDSTISENEMELTGKRKRDNKKGESTDGCSSSTSKKAKLSLAKPDAEKLTATCTAWSNTWSNRRRERRKRKHNESGGKETEILQDAVGFCKTAPSEIANDLSPVLTVSLTVSAEDTRGCWIGFQLLGDSKRENFLNFYSFFKKCFQDFLGSM